MTRIAGLNDSVTLKKKAIKPAITVWKGGKKTPRSAGADLKDKFRIEAPAHLRRTLKLAYQAEEDADGSLLVDHLNLVPAYEDEYKTFDSKMAAYNASRPIHFCDRATIHTEFIKDAKNYFQPIEASKPCPVAGTNHECPEKCARTGDFYFYIWELILAGSGEFARLQVHGVEDNQHIAQFLDDTKLSVGAIKLSPFVSEETRAYMVYKMVRRKIQSKYPVKENGVRTEKRGTKDNWVVSLNLHPIWQTRYDYFQQVQQLRTLNYQPSLKLIEQVHGENMIAPSLQSDRVKVLRAELPTPKEVCSKYKEDLAIAYRNNKWDKTGWNAMMLDTFGTTEITQDLDLELLMAIAQSGDEQKKWCEF